MLYAPAHSRCLYLLEGRSGQQLPLRWGESRACTEDRPD
jgi:hypothetical protein